MKRPTIADLARAADVSVSTVNRILNGSATVQVETIQRVRDAAAQIGFYGINVIEARKTQSMPHRRLGFLLQQSSRELYRLFGRKIEEAAAQRQGERVEPVIEFVDQLDPENIAGRLRALAATCDAVAVIAGDHPVIGQAIQALKAEGKPVVAYITDLSAPERAGYVGTDNWKLGRTAAWFIAETTRAPRRVAVLIGNHRYQCQDISDASFRSYIRENAPHLTVEDSRPTHEEPAEAQRITTRLLSETDDLAGIYVAGGGISGVLDALREAPEPKRRSVRVVCRDMGPATHRGLAEGLITASLCHPLERTSEQLVQTMLDAIGQPKGSPMLQRTIPFEIITPANV